MKTFSVLLLAGLALLAGSTAASAAGGRAHARMLGAVQHRGAAHVARTTSSTTSATRAALTCGESCASYEASINQYFTDVAHDSGTGSNVYSVATQYCQGAANLAISCNGAGTPIAYNETFAGATVDTNAFPANGCNDAYAPPGQPTGSDTTCLTDGQLQTEIQREIAANGWPTGTTHLYFIFTPSDVGVCFDSGNAGINNPCSTNSFCAYHSGFLYNGTKVIYGVEPDGATIPTGGCTSDVQDPNGTSVDPTINTISHEQNESITDPWGNGWMAADGHENGDLCAWTFGSPVTAGANYNQVINGDHYWLQEEYSNAAIPGGGCVQKLGGTATSPDPTLGDGIGPLLYNGGSVMTTNTVRAIYWFPGATPGIPANSQPPVVSGDAVVGKTLTTSTGGWTNSPTGYTYNWQSCSAAGTSCVDIPGATGSSYQLASTDSGHEIRSEVSAQNAGGSSTYAASTPTAVVVGVPQATVKPRISGTAKVGKSLTASSGTWTSSPSSYAYQWLRCSAKGTACKPISRATKPRYKLHRSDARHTLRIRVTATNAAGSGTSTSRATTTVKG